MGSGDYSMARFEVSEKCFLDRSDGALENILQTHVVINLSPKYRELVGPEGFEPSISVGRRQEWRGVCVPKYVSKPTFRTSKFV